MAVTRRNAPAQSLAGDGVHRHKTCISAFLESRLASGGAVESRHQWMDSDMDAKNADAKNIDALATDLPDGDAAGSNAPHLRSIHTDSFAEFLRETGRSVVATTYQAGFVVVLRFDGNGLNTHFRRASRPMGLATKPGTMAVGGAREVVQFANMADVASKLEGPVRHDACYLPRRVHVTGDVDIHEMAWAGDELWFVNTRFSCLCTLDQEHSFVPRWRPPFISGLSPQDRCHLNGMCLIDGRPRYVTALGSSDDAAGWRKNKANGGVLIDVDSGETVVHGLSMPHSPRWYDGRLWLLESGDGSIGTVDPATGKYEAVARVGGFTRGLDFVGPYALIGVSQVRDSAIFSGIPITERLKERICGVSLVDLRSGREVGYVRFQDAVQEMFAVQVLPHRFPELLEMDSELLGNSYALPDESLPDVAWQPEPEDPKAAANQAGAND